MWNVLKVKKRESILQRYKGIASKISGTFLIIRSKSMSNVIPNVSLVKIKRTLVGTVHRLRLSRLSGTCV